VRTPGDRHQSGLGQMLELSVTTLHPNLVPPSSSISLIASRTFIRAQCRSRSLKRNDCYILCAKSQRATFPFRRRPDRQTPRSHRSTTINALKGH
jgi:hypothetical protein